MEPLKPASPPQPACQDLAGMMEHLLLSPKLSESEVAAGVELAKKYEVAAVVVRPSDVELVARWLTGSRIALGTVVDWPYGHSTTSVKTFATGDMLRRGAKEITTVMNTGKLISRHFQYLEMELVQMADACHQSGAVLNVTLQSGHLGAYLSAHLDFSADLSAHLDDELKIVACRICRRAGVDSIVCAEIEDMSLLKQYAKERLTLKAAGSIDSLQQALQFRDAGCARLQTGNTAALLEACKAWQAGLAKARQSSVIS